MNRTGSPNRLGAALAFVWLIAVLIPIYFIVVTSFRPQKQFYSENPLSIPSSPTVGAYQRVLHNEFLRYFTNSFFVVGLSVAILLVVSLMVAFYAVRSASKKARLVLSVILLGLAIPMQATIIPVYYLIVKIRLYDTLWALILPAVGFAIPVTVLILVNFVRDIPGELFESMKVDGAPDWLILTKLVVPLSRPALVTVGIFDALNVWNGFLYPLVLTQSANKRVVPLSLWSYQGEFQTDIPAVLAAVVLSVLPLLAAYILGRRQMVAGLTAGFGK